VARSMIRGISEHTLQCKRNSPAWTVKSSPSRFGSQSADSFLPPPQ
jgi:hypothetical protein